MSAQVVELSIETLILNYNADFASMLIVISDQAAENLLDLGFWLTPQV